TASRPRRSQRVPYTTLFRSIPGAELPFNAAIIYVAIICKHLIPATGRSGNEGPHPNTILCAGALPTILAKVGKKRHNIPIFVTRSEEHTSELQSRENLVCRL